MTRRLLLVTEGILGGVALWITAPAVARAKLEPLPIAIVGSVCGLLVVLSSVFLLTVASLLGKAVLWLHSVLAWRMEWLRDILAF